MTAARPTRRIVFQGLGALGVAAVLAGCSSDDGGSSAPEPGAALAATSDVPVGGGVIVDGVVITQPTEGDFQAFVAKCTHQNATLSGVSDGLIECPLHGSRFAVADGSVVQGPATTSLTPVRIDVKDDQILAA